MRLQPFKAEVRVSRPSSRTCDRFENGKSMYGIKVDRISFHLPLPIGELGPPQRNPRCASFPCSRPNSCPRVLNLFVVSKRERKTVPQDILGIALCTCLPSCPFPSNCRELYFLQTHRISRWSRRIEHVCHMSLDLSSRSCSSWNLAMSLIRRVAVGVDVVVVEDFRVPNDR